MTPLVGREMFQLAVSLAGSVEGLGEKLRGAKGAAFITTTKILTKTCSITAVSCFQNVFYFKRKLFLYLPYAPLPFQKAAFKKNSYEWQMITMERTLPVILLNYRGIRGRDIYISGQPDPTDHRVLPRI